MKRDTIIDRMVQQCSANILRDDGALKQIYVLGISSSRIQDLSEYVASTFDTSSASIRVVREALHKIIVTDSDETEAPNMIQFEKTVDKALVCAIFSKFFRIDELDVDISSSHKDLFRNHDFSRRIDVLKQFWMIGVDMFLTTQARQLAVCGGEPEFDLPDAHEWPGALFVIDREDIDSM